MKKDKEDRLSEEAEEEAKCKKKGEEDAAAAAAANDISWADTTPVHDNRGLFAAIATTGKKKKKSKKGKVHNLGYVITSSMVLTLL